MRLHKKLALKTYSRQYYILQIFQREQGLFEIFEGTTLQ